MSSLTSVPQIIKVGDHNIAVTIRNCDGDVLDLAAIIIPGALGNSHTTKHFAQELAELRPDMYVIQIDLPGHGDSVGDPLRTTEETAAVVVELITGLQDSCVLPDKLVIIGHSWGGSIGLETVLQGLKPELLALLMTSSSWKEMSPLATFADNMLPGVFAQMMEQEWTHVPDKNLVKELKAMVPQMTASPEACGADMEALISFSIKDRLAQINVPTFVVYSEFDTTASPEMGEQLVAAIPNSQGYLLSGGSHTSIMGRYKDLAKVIAEHI